MRSALSVETISPISVCLDNVRWTQTLLPGTREVPCKLPQGRWPISRILLASFLLTTLLVADSAASPNFAVPAFQKLQSLAGEWEGTDNHGMAVRTEFQSSVSRTVIMEVLTPADMPPMTTLYSLDDNAIALVHYCPTNNQPRMRAIPSGDPARELIFDFVSAGNLPSLSVGHEHKLVIHFDDDDKFTESWTWRENGKDVIQLFHFTRKREQNAAAGKSQKPQR